MDAGEISLTKALSDINNKTGQQFVIIIDEWDAIFREDKDNKKLQKDYVDFLRGLFKGLLSDRFLKLAYITGILPIKKYGTQSALNNFRELTMIAPGGIAKYIGFTEKEVRELPTGEGFADMAFIPRRKSRKPALLVELKWDKSAEGAVAQIHDRKYVEGLEEYKDNLLLVGINYDKKTKEHQCRIEKV